MPFINEYISGEDFQKFGFASLNSRQKETSGTAPSDFWTIDRSQNTWLRCFYHESDHTAHDGGFNGISVWDYCWQGELMSAKVLTLEVGGIYGQHCWSRKKLLELDIPLHLEASRALILKDLEKAFTAYKDGGVLASATSYSFVLEV